MAIIFHLKSCFNKEAYNAQHRKDYDEMIDNFNWSNYVAKQFKFNGPPLKNLNFREGTNSSSVRWLYFGEMKDNTEGVREGRGVMVFQHGELQIGVWHQDYRNGRGRYILPKGVCFDGILKDSKRNGEGKMFWRNGDYEEAKFVDGKRDGDSKFYDFSCKQEYKRVYNNGERISEIKSSS
jgi:antitoxin component YwqK of YwqJK toxin-antitoxin module